MKQFNFDNMIKKQMGELEDSYSFEDRLWQNAATTMDTEGILRPPQRNWAQIITYSLLSLLLLSNGWLAWKYFQQQDTISHQQTDLRQLSEQLQTTNVELKEVVKQVETHSNDTITLAPTKEIHTEYKTIEKVIEKIIYLPQDNRKPFGNTQLRFMTGRPSLMSNSGFGQPLSNAYNYSDGRLNYQPLAQQDEDFTFLNADKTSSDNFSNSDFATTNDFSENINTDKSNNSNVTGSVEQEMNTAENVTTSDEFTDLEEINIAPLHYENTPLDTTALEALIDSSAFDERKLELKDYLALAYYTAQPTDFSIGIASSTDFAVQNTDFELSTIKFGVSSQLNFSDRIKVGADIFWKEMDGELEDIQDRNYPEGYFDNYPEITIGRLSPDDQLYKIEQRDRDIELGLYAKYMFLPKKKISPYIGAGLKGTYHYETRLEYYYSQAPDFEDEYNAGQFFAVDKRFGLTTYSALLGVEYDVIPRITVRLDGMYNADFKPHRFDNSQLQWFSGNVGILYNLNF